MKVINNQLVKETTKFDNVIWITVSKEMSTAKLQKDIATKIIVIFSGDEDEMTRAGVLFETLSRKSRFVMILDDLWEKISLEMIGIPEPSVGSKLVLTTRSFDVCRQMGCRIIKVKPLVEEEAWNLFADKVGVDILNIPKLKPVAKSVAERCAGLPLGIITVAASMKGIDDLSEWRNALKELSLGKKSVNGLEDEVFQQLQFSYDRLQDLKLQQCFLSCALYPEDCIIEDPRRIQLWIDEELVDEMDSRQAECDKGCVILNRLINNSLLEVVTNGHNTRCVKMHDLVRDMALHITSGTPRFLVKAGMRLMKPLNVQEWNKDLEKVSLMENWDLKVPYPLEMSPPMCPRLSTLLLSGCGIESIPEGFFVHMQGLKILDLSKNPIKGLPNSIANLKNLTALLRTNCRYLENVPSLSNLLVLKKLDLQGTNIKSVPYGMKNLLSLKYLNLSWIDNLIVIPNGMLLRPSSLQDLIVGKTLIRGEEVRELNKLEFLNGRFYDLHNLNMYVQGLNDREEPSEYNILVGKGPWVEVTSKRKCIQLRGCDIYTDQLMLPRDTEELYIKKFNFYCSEEYLLSSKFIQVSLGASSHLKSLYIDECRMKKLFSPSCVPLNLQRLTVESCELVEEIISSEVESEERGKVAMEFCLPRLRVLELRYLPELKSICSVDAVVVCDSLKRLEVVGCLKLKRMPFKLPQPDNVRAYSPLSCYVAKVVAGISGMGSP